MGRAAIGRLRLVHPLFFQKKPLDKNMLSRTQAPLIKDAVEFDLRLKPCELFTLDNGVPVYAVDAGAGYKIFLQLELVFYAGNWFEQRTVCSRCHQLPAGGNQQ